ncbi:MAG: hypothetical protein ACXWAY_12645 [Acidimicrobiia bacterium]
MDTPKVRYGQIDAEYLERLATTPPEDDGPVWMVNLMQYRDVADYSDGRATTISGREADDLYAPIGPLTAIGAEIVFFAEVNDQLLGDAPKWDRVAIVKYPTRRSFVEMQSRPDFLELHEHKEAGMEQTIIVGALPMTTPEITDPPDWADVPHPPTDDDPPVVVLHLLRFMDGGIADMTSYQDAAGLVAVPHGVRLDGWFGIEGTIIGDGRSWDQVRFNAFPSREAFMAVVFDPDRMAAHKGHREPAIADTYTLVLRPMINRIAESIG